MRLSSDPAARRRLAVLLTAALAAFAAGLAAGAGGDDRSEAHSPITPAVEAVDKLNLRQQVGQVVVSSFPDSAPPPYIRRRLRANETAGVILFGFNASGRDSWRTLTRRIQRSARGRALVMVDQEGGEIRTVEWAGPVAGQPAQSDAGRSARAAARQLSSIGINVNLAPVADLPGGPVMGFRAFSGDVAARTRAAVEGMRAAAVAATPKHFPGLGSATVNTDDGSATVTGWSERDLAPYRGTEAPLVMLSHAVYPAIDGQRIASQSPRIVTGLLRERLGYEGVIVTDSIEAQAVLDRSGVARAAERSIRAGADLVLCTGSASWNLVHPWLLRRARSSPRFRERIRRAAARVLALKEGLGLLR